MTAATPTRSAAFAHAAATLAGYLADHGLPEPESLSVSTSYGHSTLSVQLRSGTVPTVAADLLAWADTLNAVTVEAWRPPEGERVHLCLHSALTGLAGAVKLEVFGAVAYDPHRFPELQTHPHEGVSLSLGQLRSWAAETLQATATGTPVVDAHRAER
jgi:hypothetical protein